MSESTRDCAIGREYFENQLRAPDPAPADVMDVGFEDLSNK
jgi:hypothetical protein